MAEEKKLGGIELGGEFGGYEIVNKSANSLPQDLASAIGVVNSNILGATYEPIWYVGHQLVNGTNHFLIAKELRATKNQDIMIVGLIINIPPGDIGGEKAKIVRIIEEEELPEDAAMAFENATKQLLGVSYRPVAYVGKQVVKGMNYYIICEAKAIYPGANPFAVELVINEFQGKYALVSVERIQQEKKAGICLGAPLGEWP